MEKHLIYSGKVRQSYTLLMKDSVLIETSDRVSSFDRHIGIIKQGLMLNKITKWWFENQIYYR